MIKQQAFLKEKSEEILGQMGIAASAELAEGAERIMVNITPKEEADSPLLIGFHGQTLNALQTVLNVMFLRKFKEFSPFTLEVGGYRKEREEELRRRALEAADKARFLLKEVSFPAMPPSERRIVHITLEGEKGVRTESRGEGRDRHVVVVPESKQTVNSEQ